jgi:hypothetical protein
LIADESMGLGASVALPLLKARPDLPAEIELAAGAAH